MGLREQIFAASDRKRRTREVPEWGGTITLLELDGVERELVEKAAREGSHGDFRVAVVALSVANPNDGSRVFGEADFAELKHRCGRILEELFSDACELSCLGVKGAARAEEN